MIRPGPAAHTMLPVGRHALPGHHAEVLLAADVRVGPGVVDPVEVLGHRLGRHQQRVDPVHREPGRGPAVVQELDLEVVLLFPLHGVADVGGCHPDRRGHRRALGAGAWRRACSDRSMLHCASPRNMSS